MATADFDYILVGGGLQNGLIALALRARQPRSRVALIERAHRVGGNHTWCFHSNDHPGGGWVDPLVCHRWGGYRVSFPGFTRRIDDEYAAITSDRFHEVVSDAVEELSGSVLMTGTHVERVGARDVDVAGVGTLAGRLVVDARGPASVPNARCGYQKFLGLELELDEPHDLDAPLLMDATVDQEHGFHFFYTLPLSETRVLVEDTFFHESSSLEPESLRADIRSYAEGRGWEVVRVIREETGVLPMPWTGSLPHAGASPLRGGYGGGWFHAGTGYSFPVAVRLARLVAQHGPEPADQLAAMARAVAGQTRFCHLLNRFLFRWYPPANRWNIFERFYRLPVDTIRRFYALQLTPRDRVRLLSGRPPRGISAAYRLTSGGRP
jgi:lycopene beta-cyclase